MTPQPPPLEMDRLVADHHQAVYRYAFRLAGSVPDAEDLTQQTFLTAQTRLGQLREPAAARSWLLTILRNTYIRSNRKPRPIPAANLELNVDHLPAELVESPVDQERLQAALDELADEFKLVLVMFYFEGCSYREIADRLDVPQGTVMSRLWRAKAHLRERLFEPELNASKSHGSTAETRYA